MHAETGHTAGAPGQITALAGEGAVDRSGPAPFWPEPDGRAASAPPSGGEPAIRALWTAWSSFDPAAAVTAAAGQAAEGIARGAADEPTWYAMLRGREMLGDDGPIVAGHHRWRSLLHAAEAAAQRFEASPRVTTVRARLEGGVPAARAALTVNPAYTPAQVALGWALLREGRSRVARALLEQVREPERVQGAGVALARARVETGDPGQALIAAARETNAPGLGGVEPSIHDPGVLRDLDEVRGMARMALGAVEAGARSLLRAVAAGSAVARRTLAAHAARSEVRRALVRLSRDAALPAVSRALAASLAA